MSHTPSDAITTDSKISRDATSARALAALAGSCFMEERLTYRGHENTLFSHDGIHDSQTHLAAPTYFYEQLKQEIALSDRTGEMFSLIRIIFNRSNCKGESIEDKIGAADILYFSEALKDLTRKQDCVARVGVNECVILVRARKSNVESLLSRLLLSHKLTVENSLQISCSTVEFSPGEKALTILNRLDAMNLSTH
jgi:GGDEF domain-containing protein